jgi:hypothetical protein
MSSCPWEFSFFLSCLIESIIHQLSGSTIIFVKNKHQKAANFMFGLILPVALTPACFLEGQFIDHKIVAPIDVWQSYFASIC